MLEFMDALLWGAGVLVWLAAAIFCLGVMSGHIVIHREEINDADET